MQLEEVKKYYKNGNLHYHYFRDEQERVQGKYICYLNNGITKDLEVTFKDGKRHGKRIEYYNSDGAIFSINYYWHGEIITRAEFLKLKYDEVTKCV